MMCLSPIINMEHPTSTHNSSAVTSDHKTEPHEWGSPLGTTRASPDPQDHRKSLTLPSSLPRSWRQRRAVTPPLEDDDYSDEQTHPHHVTLDESHNIVHSIPTALACLREAMSMENEDGDANADAKQILWYNRDDIRAFRREAQIISQRLRQEQYQDDDHDSDSDSDEEDDDDQRPSKDHDQDEDDCCTRGLELRTSLQRQERKQRIVRRILEAQEDGYSPNELARLAGQYAVYSRQLAVAQARQDYYAVYHPNLVATATTFYAGSALCGMSASLSPSSAPSLSPRSSSSSSKFGRPLLRLDHHTTTTDNKKRSLCWEPTSPSITGRRVRCRMF